MAIAIFQPAENFVRNGVRKNITTALAVSWWHFNALTAASGNPAILALLILYTPFHTNLVNASALKTGSKGTQKSDTAAKNLLFLMLTQERLPLWMQMIGNVYPIGSLGWINLFPNGMKHFNSGTIANKLIALQTLRDKCALDGALIAVSPLITTFYTLIEGARINQQGEKSTVAINISLQQSAIEAMCIQQFSDYGTIVSLNPNSPTAIKSFIAVSELQKKVHGPIYNGTVNKNKIKCFVTKKATPATKILVNCDVDCMVWITDSINNPNHPTGGYVAAGTPTVVAFPTLGNFNNRVFQIKNLSLTTKGNYSIEFI
jgi:hypothetical protein